MSENEENRGVEAPTQLEQERGIPSVNSKRGGGKAGKILGIAALLAIVGVMAWMQLRPKSAPIERQAATTEARRGLPALDLGTPPPPPPPPAPPQAAAAGTPAPAGQVTATPTNQKHEPTEAELLLERRKRAPIFAFAGGDVAGSGAAAAPGPGEGGLGGDDDRGPDREGLAANLQATRTDAISAAMLPDRNYLVTKGTFLDCALITALDSTLPGMTSCRMTRNIYSDNGKVLLLERGSIVEGEYRSGQMRQGMNRIFVLWTRVRTPKGVVVKLDSPGADELGRSGMPGWVNSHFWKRYGAALMLSLVDDTAEYLVQQQRSSGGDSISFSGTGDATSQAAAIALQNSINIPPTLNKNQGDLINIYVARDMDFRGVYELRSR